jgi:hypothetical protein
VAATAEHPVIMGEWGFTTDLTYDDEWHIVIGSQSNYGEPLKDFLEENGIGNIAWVASHNWGPPMFYSNWTLRCGEGEMGCFAKDWLFEASGQAQTVTANITKCKVKAGKIQGIDNFDASGTFASSLWMLYLINQIDVNIVSLADDAVIYSETIEDFNDYYNSGTGKFKYSYKVPSGAEGAITSLKFDFSRRTFALKLKNVNLTGLACPLQLNMTLGNFLLSGEADEDVVNGKKTVPTRLMRTYQDTLIVTKAKATNSAASLADAFTVKGDIAIEVTDVNLVNEDVVVTWSDANEISVQTFTIPADSFVADKTGYVFKCSKITPTEGQGQVAAKIDLYKSLFTLTIKGIDLDTTTGDIKFGLSFGDFNETDEYALP